MSTGPATAVLANTFSDAAGSVWELITGATDYLDELSSNWWFLLIIFVIALLDSVVPIVPSETAVIVGGVAAGQGNQALLLVILAGAVGAWVGDNLAYVIGDKLSRLIERVAARRPSLQQRLDWAAQQIRIRGGLLLITVRFIPGGRTALTISSGITHQPRRWFMIWIAIATTVWATYGAVLGYVFGEAFEDDHTKAFLIAFVTALSITGVIEIGRHLWGKWHEQPEPAGTDS